MTNNKIFMLLDRSGSMAGRMWEEAISGINSYVEKLYGTSADVMLAVFDSQGYDIIRNTNTANWKNLEQNEISPRGSTPLLDSAARIMQQMMDSKAERAVLVVITDGYENASTKFKASEIKEMTRSLTTKYNYDIVFLGANFDGINDVAMQNFGVSDAGKFMSSSVRGFAGAMNTTAMGSMDYLNTGKTMSYTDEDKAKAKAE